MRGVKLKVTWSCDLGQPIRNSRLEKSGSSDKFFLTRGITVRPNLLYFSQPFVVCHSLYILLHSVTAEDVISNDKPGSGTCG
jgi:hypothetical protein